MGGGVGQTIYSVFFYICELQNFNFFSWWPKQKLSALPSDILTEQWNTIKLYHQVHHCVDDTNLMYLSKFIKKFNILIQKKALKNYFN